MDLAHTSDLLEQFTELHRHHWENCQPYQRVAKQIFHVKKNTRFSSLNELPFLPVSLFKHQDLKSIKDEDVFKVMHSSGTTSQTPSRVYLDKATSQKQSVALIKIFQSHLGKNRLPMVIIDSPDTIKDRHSFSARTAGILGMMQFGKDHTFCLDHGMHLDLQALQSFLSRHQNEPILIFGFTFMIWQNFLQEIKRAQVKLDLSQAFIVHSGGWKKLQAQAVTNAAFKQELRHFTQAEPGKILNFYGMVEQVGSVFVESPSGSLQTPDFAEVIIRDPVSFMPLADGKEGLIQVLSVLPFSYPGHSILTEDLGTITGRANKHTQFLVKRRLPKAELRGCSDTYTHERI